MKLSPEVLRNQSAVRAQGMCGFVEDSVSEGLRMCILAPRHDGGVHTELGPQEPPQSPHDRIRERLRPTIVISQASGDEISMALDDVENNGATYYMKPTSETPVACVLIPFERYEELLRVERA